ncbi:MAG: transposase [Betaproteobacteria bacterium]|nr:transposase [Betaproteobacteria bacterium]
MKLLTRRAVLVEEEGSTYTADNDDGDSDEARVLRPLQSAACTCRIASGPRAGQKALTVQSAMPRETDFEQPLCADIEGFSLHAPVRCDADDRKALEQLCCYITRRALANDRNSAVNRRGPVSGASDLSIPKRHADLPRSAAHAYLQDLPFRRGTRGGDLVSIDPTRGGQGADTGCHATALIRHCRHHAP